MLAGECTLLVEGEERRLRVWDFFHSPPWTEHAFVGAGDGPCVILMIGARSSPEVRYPVTELAARYGASVAEDVSGFKTLSLAVYATGIPIMRLEAISGERGRDMSMTYPQMTFKVLRGLNTYKVPLTGFAQPAWVTDRRVDPKDIFKKLTSINLTAFCDQCDVNKQGMVIADNVIFEK